MKRSNGKTFPVFDSEARREKIKLENEKILHLKNDQNLIASTFKAFSSNTSIHAIHYLTEESIRMIEKSLWLLIILLASLAMGYCCLLLSSRFRSSFTSTVFESTYFPVAEIPFAAITLCNNNRLNSNKTESAIEKFLSPNRTKSETQIFVKIVEVKNFNFKILN